MRKQLRKNLQTVHAVLEWPDKKLLASVEEEFPDAGVAGVEEARVRTESVKQTLLHTCREEEDESGSILLEELGSKASLSSSISINFVSLFSGINMTNKELE